MKSGPGFFWTCDCNKYNLVSYYDGGAAYLDNMPNYNPAGKIDGPTGAAWLSIAHNWPEVTDASTSTSIYPGAFDPLTFLPLDSETSGSQTTYLCDKSNIKGASNDNVTIPSYGGVNYDGKDAGPFSVYGIDVYTDTVRHWHRGAC